MGWRFRKAWNRGPFRLTLTQRGIAASVGIAGIYRITRKARGGWRSTVRAPGTGLYYQHEHPRARRSLPCCTYCHKYHWGRCGE